MKIGATNWPEVEKIWQNQEEEIWGNFYGEKGFKSWEDWRWSTITILGLRNRIWQRVQIINPKEEVGKMYCNSLTRWTDFYQERSKSTFNDLSSHPFFKNHNKVLSITRDFPNETQIIGLKHENKTMLVDGHHRGISLAQMNELEALGKNLYLASTELDQVEFERFFNPSKSLRLKRKIFDLIGLTQSKTGFKFPFSKN